MIRRVEDRAKKAPPSRAEHERWLADVSPKHQRLTRAVVSLLENLLTERQIEFLSVTGRTKELAHAIEKIDRKQYRDPESQLTDLSAIRVVTFLESQVSRVTGIARELFDVDETNSLDRSRALGSDKIGYRSTHFVCSLGRNRSSLAEYESLGDLKFEIQIRTVLQHAWAELAHDRSFKFGPGLPTEIQRKLNLHSGLLEIVDAAFDNLAREIDAYASSIDKKSLAQIGGAEISAITLHKFLTSTAKTEKIQITAIDELHSAIFQEINHFGIKKIADLEALVTPEAMKAYKSVKGSDTGVGFVRQLLMHADIDKYFSGPVGWSGIDRESFQRLLKRYDAEKLRALFELHDIVFLDSDDEEEPFEKDDSVPI